MKITVPLMRTIRVLMAKPDYHHYAYEIQTQNGVASGVLNTLLRNLRVAGFLESYWDNSKPARKYYLVTAAGREEFTRLLEETSHDPKAPWWSAHKSS